MANNVVVMGMGVVGFPTALLLAGAGYKVTGVDINGKILDFLKQRELPPQIKEEEFRKLLQDSNTWKNLTFQGTPTHADFFIIAVPTPLDSSKKKADLTYVKSAIEAITPFLKKGDLIIIESTIPPKTCKDFLTPMLEKRSFKVGEDIFLAHCPERVLPGNIYREIVKNDRIIGGVNEKSSEMARKLYSAFAKGEIYLTDDVTAELCKLMENSFRDVNIALANEFALVAQKLGIDSQTVINLANKHPRVNILNPGIGVGGHCIPIDPWFIHQVAPQESQLIAQARNINDQMPSKIAKEIAEEVKMIKNPHIVAVGMSYKPDTADTRESPALEVVRLLRKSGVKVDHYDPLLEEYKYPTNLVNLCFKADLLVILVPHKIVMDEIAANRELINKSLTRHKILEY